MITYAITSFLYSFTIILFSGWWAKKTITDLNSESKLPSEKS